MNYKKERNFIWIAFVIFPAAALFLFLVVLPHYQAQISAAISSQTPTTEPTIFLYPTLTPTFTATKIVYRPITWMQLVSFLEKDPTNLNKYTPDYVCLNFAEDLVEDAQNENIQAWIVGVQLYAPEDHAIVVFKTTDRGVVYIEPQDDNPFIKPTVGQPLCEEGTGKKCLGTIVSFLNVQCDAHWHNCTATFVPSWVTKIKLTPVNAP
jgi:hypothetical protein